MKKVLKIIGILLILVIMLIGGCFGWLKYEQSKYSSTAVPYLKQVIPELARWDVGVARSYFAPALLAKTSDADLEKMVKWFGKLGALKSMDEPEFARVFTGANTTDGAIKTVTYTIKAHFDAGDGVLTIALQDDGSGFKIYSLFINSPALAG